MARFAAFLQQKKREDEASAKAERQRSKDEAAARDAAVASADRERSIREEHVAAVSALKQARRDGRRVAEAEQRWQAASAALLELETGERPAWGAVPEEPAGPTDAAPEAAADGEPADGAADPD